MATIYEFGDHDGESLAFSAGDTLHFDASVRFAFLLGIVPSGDGNSVTFSYGDKSVTLQTSLASLTSSSLAFDGPPAFQPGTAAADSLAGSGRNDVFIGFAGNDTMTGNGGDDMFWLFSSPATAYATAGAETLNGGNGSFDWIALPGDSTFAATVNLKLGTVTGGGYSASNSATLLGIEGAIGTGLDDTFIGSNLADPTEIFEGRGGNDSINGGGGFDLAAYFSSPGAVMVNLLTKTASDGYGGTDSLTAVEGAIGSAFNDTLTGNGSSNAFIGMAGNDSFSGAGGIDQVLYLFDPAGVSANLTTKTAQDGFGGTDVLVSIENAEGSDFNDTLVGSGFENQLTGHDGNDSLSGGGGDDTLFGNDGTDTLVGGAGNDYLDGYPDDQGVPQSQDATPSSDSMVGGTGDDRYLVDDAGDTVVEINGLTGGDDAVASSVTYTLPNSVETLLLTGSDSINGTGNGASNRIEGNDAPNLLIGGGGADTLEGNGGNDTMDGGPGSDLLIAQPGDTVSDTGGAIDTDTVQLLSGFITLGNGIEDVTFSDTAQSADGNKLANDMWGNDLANTLQGFGGDDVLTGFGGNDVLRGGAGDDEAVGGDGNDTLDGAAGDDSLAGGQGADRLTGSDGDDTLTGDDSIGVFANDTLLGGLGADQLFGGGGNDSLDAGNDSSADTLVGGQGNDLYVLGMGDTVIEESGSGTDTVKINGGVYTLNANVEIGTLTAPGFLTGNGEGNLLNGSSGNDTLDGGMGIATMNGNFGNDVLFFNAGTPLPSFNGGGPTVDEIDNGWDTIKYQGESMGGVDFRNLSSDYIQNIDVIDLNNGNNSVSIDYQFVLDATDFSDTINPSGDDLINSLYIDGGSTDHVHGPQDQASESWNKDPTPVNGYWHYYLGDGPDQANLYIKTTIADHYISDHSDGPT